jgi:hypothetical protein
MQTQNEQTQAAKKQVHPHINVTALRLAIGLLQGICFYGLTRAAVHQTWPAQKNYFGTFYFLAAFIPLLSISALGQLSKRQLFGWTISASIVITALGLYDFWKTVAINTSNHSLPVSFLLFIGLTFGFYIAHCLVIAGSSEQKRIASYANYFEQSWKVLIQALFSTLFVGVIWLVLSMGAVLFTILDLSFFDALLSKSWFYLPVITFAFACGIHITDVKPSVVRNIRNLLLSLLAWALPIATLFVAGFLLALPWTGLQPLWNTRHASWVLLSAALALVLLINAAYQNGQSAHEVTRVIRLSARIAAFCLLPIVLISLYALSLRVGDYGWTNDRILGAFCITLSLSYAIGYGWAATRSTWLEPIAHVNTLNAFVILAILLALNSPIADVARLSTNNQIDRLNNGKISAQDFDYRYLRFHGDRYGMEALQELSKRNWGKDAELIREKASQALKLKNRWEDLESDSKTNEQILTDIHVWPSHEKLPLLLVKQDGKTDWQLPECFTRAKRTCDAYRIPSRINQSSTWLLVGDTFEDNAVIVSQNTNKTWEVIATLPRGLAGCKELRQHMQAGNWKLIAKPSYDLEIAGQRIVIETVEEASPNPCTKKQTP